MDGVARQSGAAADEQLGALPGILEGHEVAPADWPPPQASVAEETVGGAYAQPVAPAVDEHAVARHQGGFESIALNGADVENQSLHGQQGHEGDGKSHYELVYGLYGSDGSEGGLFDVVDYAEETAPADASIEERTVGVAAPPDEDGLAHDVVFGHEAPVA